MSEWDDKYVQGLEFRCDELEEFASELAYELHYQHHDNHPLKLCQWDICLKAKELGL